MRKKSSDIEFWKEGETIAHSKLTAPPNLSLHTYNDASVHDCQLFGELLRRSEAGRKEVWADSAYRLEKQEASNETESRACARVFGTMEDDMDRILTVHYWLRECASGRGHDEPVRHSQSH